ncbi:MAG TPA: metalloregulator ArsR/SmtB family transcription factor [Polyangiaceae bacterium]|nr:metalloregulator ArsR/SmtB family transcription factor [Polyangiaceae bacterium]
MPVKCVPPANGRQQVATWAKAMAFTPDLDERAALLSLLGNATRLRAFYVLDQLGECCVCDLADILGVTQSAVSQHLAKFKAYGLVSVRRDAQTLFYRLADKPEVKRLRKLAVEGIEAPAT